MADWDRAWLERLHVIFEDVAFRPVLSQTKIRQDITRDDPVAFAITYFRHHLGDRDGRLTFSEAHFAWARLAQEWMTTPTEPQQQRHAVIAPRECGKSTWWFLILPMWAAAHGH